MSWRLLLVCLACLGPACIFRRQPPPGASGTQIYELQNCANCHGDAREGTRRGPPLAGLEAHWSVDLLAEYLADPQGIVERDPRLQAFGKEYEGSEMGRYDNLDLDLRRTLASWLLEDGPR